MTKPPSFEVLQLVEEHLPLAPTPVRDIWESSGRMWALDTWRNALKHLATDNKAQRDLEPVKWGGEQYRYWRAD